MLGCRHIIRPAWSWPRPSAGGPQTPAATALATRGTATGVFNPVTWSSRQIYRRQRHRPAFHAAHRSFDQILTPIRYDGLLQGQLVQRLGGGLDRQPSWHRPWPPLPGQRWPHLHASLQPQAGSQRASRRSGPSHRCPAWANGHERTTIALLHPMCDFAATAAVTGSIRSKSFAIGLAVLPGCEKGARIHGQGLRLRPPWSQVVGYDR